MTPDMPADEIKRINPFDWDTEFADIIKVGGFDAVIGNPPYVRMEGFKEVKNYLKSHYAVPRRKSGSLYLLHRKRAEDSST